MCYAKPSGWTSNGNFSVIRLGNLAGNVSAPQAYLTIMFLTIMFFDERFNYP